MPKYFTLIEFFGGAWSPQFGDYKRSVVVQERHDRHHSWPHTALKNMRVIQTDDDSQASINRLVREINDALKAKQQQTKVEP